MGWVSAALIAGKEVSFGRPAAAPRRGVAVECVTDPMAPHKTRKVPVHMFFLYVIVGNTDFV